MDLRLARAHVALIADEGAWRELPARIARDPVLARIAEATRARVRTHFASPPITHVLVGKRQLTSARLFLGRILDLATVARLDNDAAAATRAKEELLLAASLPSWNPDHFLDVGEYALGAGIGLGWLRDALSEAETERVAKALVERALRPSFEGTPHMLRWLGGTSNWTQVCHAGLVAAALAVADREPALAARTVARAIAEQAGPATAYAPDGAYAEGPIYWGYGTSFQVVMISLLEAATGSDHGLADFPGFLASADYLAQMVAPSGRFFNYADSREQVPALPVLHWFAARRGEPGIAAAELRRLERGTWDSGIMSRPEYERLDALALWWRAWSPVADGDATAGGDADSAAREMPRVWWAGGETPVGVARTAWGDPQAAFVAVKGGRASTSHAHNDAGSFIYEAGGVRWALDPGMQEYHELEAAGVQLWDFSPGGERWKVFRLGAESHNLLRFDDAQPDVLAAATLRAWGDRGFELDLVALHAPRVQSAVRRVELAEDGALLVEDVWRAGEAAVLARWQWLTRAEVEPVADGALLRQDGRALRLRVEEPTADGEWSLVVESVEGLLRPTDAPCPGWKRLTFRVSTGARAEGRIKIAAALV